MINGLLAFLLLATLGITGEILLLDRLRGALNHSSVNEWLAEHVYLPALRIPALIGFVLAAYPALYGLESGPALTLLLDFDWFGRALNILFFLPLLFSLLPIAGRVTALVLPLQGMALTALLFMPVAASSGVADVAWLPGFDTLVALLVFGGGGHVLGTRIAEHLPRRRLSLPAYDLVVLFCQAPAILAYGSQLGVQLN